MSANRACAVLNCCSVSPNISGISNAQQRFSEYLTAIGTTHVIDRDRLDITQVPRDLIPWIMLFEIDNGPRRSFGNYKFVVMGTQVAGMIGKDLTRKSIAEYPWEGCRKFMQEGIDHCTTSLKPLFAKRWLFFNGDFERSVECSIYPMLRRGQLGAISLLSLPQSARDFGDSGAPLKTNEDIWLRSSVMDWDLSRAERLQTPSTVDPVSP